MQSPYNLCVINNKCVSKQKYGIVGYNHRDANKIPREQSGRL